MCFSYAVRNEFYRETWRRARKRHVCGECHVPILPGEEYQEVFGIWDGDPMTERTCAFCHWLRERVAAAEMEHGCHSGEAYPAFTALYEALDDGHGKEIGLVDLLCYHEGD